jgi:hypothetical protein
MSSGALSTRSVFYFGPTEVFGSCFELREQGQSFITTFHKEYGNKTRIAINENDVVGEVAVATWKWATNVTMDSFEECRCSQGCFVWERETMNVGPSTDVTRRTRGVIEQEAISSIMEPFYAYVAH